jgi:hypothetical protein
VAQVPICLNEKGNLMSRDAAATIYARVLTDSGFRDAISPELLAAYDLTANESAILLREARYQDVVHSAKGEMISYLRTGPGLSPRVASALGAAVNEARGLPTNGIREKGHTSGASDCCPWNKPPVPWREGISE